MYSARSIVFDVDMCVGEIPPSAMTGAMKSSNLTLREFLSFFFAFTFLPTWMLILISNVSVDYFGIYHFII